jgi:biopolymer transport protein ExbD
MKINSDNLDQEPRIELVPLIDVIFCILTFFLLAGLQVARQQAISVDIPKASSGAPAARELLMVTLNDTGQLFLEQQPMLIPGQLVEAVKQYRQARPNSSIVLYASKQVSYNKVVEVLDALRGVAGDRVALATLPSNTAAPTPPVLTTPPGYGYPYPPYNPYSPGNPATPPPNSSITNPQPTQPSGIGTSPTGATPSTGSISPSPTAVGQSPQVTPNLPTQPAASTTPSTSPSP